ncbi:hypothetical protein M8818_005768 [Zalaria obscura]|uniref:Uncharacterized protein n=1 Tax=Zalaria obscura TaxID=2024903 RepID=A0ACC3S9H9_9PEZI
MRSPKTLPHRTALLTLLLAALLCLPYADALSQSYCSSENTGSGYDVDYDIYQSNGACHDTCVDNYAFAIVQYQNCWCSNYAPADTVDVSECNTDCPGYPDEQCGNSDQDLFGYIKLDRAASGTAGGSSSAASSTTSTTASSTTEESSVSFDRISYC